MSRSPETNIVDKKTRVGLPNKAIALIPSHNCVNGLVVIPSLPYAATATAAATHGRQQSCGRRGGTREWRR